MGPLVRHESDQPVSVEEGQPIIASPKSGHRSILIGGATKWVRKMAEADLVEAIQYSIEIALTSFGLYLTVTFAYLSVAYLAGSKLTKFQATAVSGLYLIAAVATTLTCLTTHQMLGELLSSLSSTTRVFSEIRLMNSEFWKAYIFSLMSLGMIVSLYFMHDCRRRGTPEVSLK